MAISGKGEGKAKGAAKSVPARPASERPVRPVDDLHCDDNMRRAARFTIRASPFTEILAALDQWKDRL
jgi:hypothetical protein